MKIILKEYSNKTINDTIERWKVDYPGIDDNVAKSLIQRFDQVKGGISSKLNQLALSDELKKNNNYLNIDKYSFKEMFDLIRSYPENPKKIAKDAIANFTKQDQIDVATASSYVKRFFQKKREIKYAIDNGTEDGTYSKEQVTQLIPKRLIQNGGWADPRLWRFQALEQMLDTLFPIMGKVEDVDENTATTNADLVYNKNNLEVYKGDSQHKCVSYNPTINKRKKYGWCISQPGNSMYDNYRFQGGGTNRMFYFVFDRDLGDEDKYHAFVIHVGEDNKIYWVTDAPNSGDRKFDQWEDLTKFLPERTWAKMQGLEKVFQYKAPAKSEISAAALRGKKLSPRDFAELDYDTKEEYVKANAGKLSEDLLPILDKELKNLAINFGQKFPYALLKNNESLLKRYAIFRFRHTDYSKYPIPLPYVKYLDDNAKRKYLEEFEDNVTFEYLEQYFGPQITEEYVEEKIKEFDYLPSEAQKYIKDPKKKELFNTYSTLYKNWSPSNDNFNIEEEKLENLTDMPIQEVNPSPFLLDDWKQLTSSQKDVLIKLAEKVNDKEKYSTLLYGLPYIIRGNDYKLLFPLSSDYEVDGWVLTDKSGDIIKNNINGGTLGDNVLDANKYPMFNTNFSRVFDQSELKDKNGKPII
jgi:hypothetical protein